MAITILRTEVSKSKLGIDVQTQELKWSSFYTRRIPPPTKEEEAYMLALYNMEHRTKQNQESQTPSPERK